MLQSSSDSAQVDCTHFADAELNFKINNFSSEGGKVFLKKIPSTSHSICSAASLTMRFRFANIARDAGVGVEKFRFFNQRR